MTDRFSTNGKPDAVKIAVLAEKQAAKSFTAMRPATPEQMADKVAFFTREYERAAKSECANRAQEIADKANAPLPNAHVPKGMTLTKAQEKYDEWALEWNHAWGGMSRDRNERMAKASEHRSYWSDVMTVLRAREERKAA